MSARHRRDVVIGLVLLLAVVDPAPARAASVRVEFETVPTLPHARFESEGTVVETDAEGRGVIEVTDVEQLPALEIVDDGIAEPDRRAEFSRWWGVSQARGKVRARAVFDLYDRITWSYAEVGGRPVDPVLVSKLVVRSSHGNVHTYEQPEPVWLHSLRVVPTVGGLSPKEIDYRIESVLVDGADVVIRNKQKFVAARQPHWTIEVLFFTAQMSARDAVLGFPVGRAVQIEYPSGRVARYELGPDANLELRLPRGSYRALVEAPGMRVWTPVALSRDQQIPIKVVTYLDMGLGVGLLAAIAIGLLLAGRPHLVIRRAPVALPGACPGGCPPSATVARFCRFCGTPRPGARVALPEHGEVAAPVGGNGG